MKYSIKEGVEFLHEGITYRVSKVGAGLSKAVNTKTNEEVIFFNGQIRDYLYHKEQSEEKPLTEATASESAAGFTLSFQPQGHDLYITSLYYKLLTRRLKSGRNLQEVAGRFEWFLEKDLISGKLTPPAFAVYRTSLCDAVTQLTIERVVEKK